MTGDEMIEKLGFVKATENEDWIEYCYDPTHEFLSKPKTIFRIEKDDGGFYYRHVNGIESADLPLKFMKAIFTKYKEMGLLDNAN